jgi:hypothetical protein
VIHNGFEPSLFNGINPPPAAGFIYTRSKSRVGFQKFRGNLVPSGWVNDSELEAEFQETVNKSKPFSKPERWRRRLRGEGD